MVYIENNLAYINVKTLESTAFCLKEIYMNDCVYKKIQYDF